DTGLPIPRRGRLRSRSPSLSATATRLATSCVSSKMPVSVVFCVQLARFTSSATPDYRIVSLTRHRLLHLLKNRLRHQPSDVGAGAGKQRAKMSVLGSEACA